LKKKSNRELTKEKDLLRKSSDGTASAEAGVEISYPAVYDSRFQNSLEG